VIHLSRLAEDLILYSSAEFGFIEFTDGNSKFSHSLNSGKDSENLEIIRGRAGKISGHQAALFAAMKSLPLGAREDLQETEEAIFDTIDTVKSCLMIAKSVLANARLDEQKTLQAATTGYLNANELADYLLQRGASHRTAAKIVSDAVSYAVAQKKELGDLSLKEMRQFSENIGDDIFEALSIEQTLAGKNQIGGTSPERVFEALEQARTDIEREEKQ